MPAVWHRRKPQNPLSRMDRAGSRPLAVSLGAGVAFCRIGGQRLRLCDVIAECLLGGLRIRRERRDEARKVRTGYVAHLAAEVRYVLRREGFAEVLEDDRRAGYRNVGVRGTGKAKDQGGCKVARECWGRLPGIGA